MTLTDHEIQVLLDNHNCSHCLPDVSEFRRMKQEGAKGVKDKVRKIISVIEQSWNSEDGEYSIGCVNILKMLKEDVLEDK